jgi:hypothetical protein
MKVNTSKQSVKFLCWYLPVILIVLSFSSGCKKWYGIPEDLEYLSDRADYTVKSYSPVLGRTTLHRDVFNHNASSLPLKFEIQNVRDKNGIPVNELTTARPTLVWKSNYTGLETSLEEIEAKRVLEEHAPLEIRGTGEVVFWSSANNSNVTNFQGAPAPAVAGGYQFDVKVSNSGGSKIIKDLVVNPFRERPYEPWGKDNVTGLPNASINPEISGIVGAVTGRELSNGNAASDSANRDVRIIFTKKGDGNTLTLKFLDKDFKPINPARFNLTKWEDLIHGFNMDKQPEYVRYTVAYPIPLSSLPTVAYPIPLSSLPTKYTTSNGSQAAITVSYDRKAFNGVRRTSTIKFNFGIYEKGDWEIAFQFRRENPKFEDD